MEIFSASLRPNKAGAILVSIYDFFAEGKKSKYRWFKVVGFGGGGLVGSKKV